jgi:hypothetical protein
MKQSDLISEYRILKIFYKICFNRHEKFLNCSKKIPLKKENEEKLGSKEYQKILFLVFCRSKKMSKHIPKEMVLTFFDLKKGVN